MWSASASESSIVIGPTSRRTRPRLSSRRVLSRGSSGRSDARRSTSTSASLFRAPRRVRPERLRPRAAALARFEPALARRRARRFVGMRAARHGERRAQLLDEPLDRELAVPRLAALVLGDGAQHGPARATTRRFCVSVSALDASTSNSASTRVDDFCACCPPGPLERETRSSISETGRREYADPLRPGKAGTSLWSPPRSLRLIDSRSMACILLDIDGVLHVSGEPIPGAAEAVGSSGARATRSASSPTTRRGRASRLAEELREMGFTLEDDELQTTPGAAARELAGKRVLALVMAAIVPTSTASSSSATTPRPCSSAAATRRSSRTRSSAT